MSIEGKDYRRSFLSPSLSEGARDGPFIALMSAGGVSAGLLLAGLSFEKAVEIEAAHVIYMDEVAAPSLGDRPYAVDEVALTALSDRYLTKAAVILNDSSLNTSEVKSLRKSASAMDNYVLTDFGPAI